MTCSRVARVYVQPVETKEFVCLVRLEHERCDEYVARRRNRTWIVRSRRRDVDCVLPA